MSCAGNLLFKQEKNEHQLFRIQEATSFYHGPFFRPPTTAFHSEELQLFW